MNAYRLFTRDEAAAICAHLQAQEWAKGEASNDSTVTKHNQELSGPSVQAQADEIAARIANGPIPRLHFVEQLSPVKFNRYSGGGEYGPHADAARMYGGLRTDLACTLFLNDGYTGGELCVGGHEVKLPPGECIVYECWRPHYVKPVTEGERICAILWIQSYIRSEEQRDLLGMLRAAILDTHDEQQYARLGAIHEKLVKIWWQT